MTLSEGVVGRLSSSSLPSCSTTLATLSPEASMASTLSKILLGSTSLSGPRSLASSAEAAETSVRTLSITP